MKRKPNSAKLLAALVKKEAIDLVLMGKQAIDTDANQTPQMLSTLLQWPCVCYASNIRIDLTHNHITAECEWDDGSEVSAETNVPAVIGYDLHLNKPAPTSLMAIMQAKNKPLETIATNKLTGDLKHHQNAYAITTRATASTSTN